MANVPQNTFMGSGVTSNLIGLGVPMQEQLSLQNRASNLANLIAQAHERLDRLVSVEQTPATPSPALPPLSASINMATDDAGRLLLRLDDLCERVGQI